MMVTEFFKCAYLYGQYWVTTMHCHGSNALARDIEIDYYSRFRKPCHGVFFFLFSRGVNGLWQLPKMVGYPFGAHVAQAILTAKCLGTDVAVLN
jgi:hypothetical protein